MNINCYISEIYQKYCMEMCNQKAAAPMTEAEFEKWFSKKTENLQSVRIENKGILFYSLYEEEEIIYCNIPIYGFFSSDEIVLSELFEELGNRIVRKKTVIFSVDLYAHDISSMHLFSMLQFGIISVKGIRKSECIPSEDDTIRELSKTEIANRWPEVWKLTDAIVKHLQKSPVFYPGKEFTEELYRSFYMDEGTKLYGAFDRNDVLVGIIETNNEQNELTFGKNSSVNIGEIYVHPEFRDLGLARKLLAFAETNSKAEYLWVEHGTANPDARRFWGKYFTTYQYTMTREIQTW